MPNTNKKMREDMFKNILNFPENKTEDEIISRTIDGNRFYTFPGGAETGRAMYTPGTEEERSEISKRFHERGRVMEEEREKYIRGGIVIEEGRKKLENKKAELKRRQDEYDTLMKRGYSETNLRGREEAITKLRNDIYEHDEWLAGYDVLQKQITDFETEQKQKETTGGQRAYELKKEEVKKPFEQTPEGLIIKSQAEIEKERVKGTGKITEAKILELANKSFDETKKEILNPDEQEAFEANRGDYVQNYIKANQGLISADEEKVAPTEQTGLIGGKRITIKSNTEATVEGEAFNITANKDLVPKTVRGLILTLPQRPDSVEIEKAIIQEAGGKNKPLTYESVRNLYARAVRNGDTELSSAFLDILPHLPVTVEENELKHPEDVPKNQTEARQSKGPEGEKAKERKGKLTEISRLTKDPKFGKDSYGNVLSLHLDDGHYLDYREIQDALNGDFDSWMNKVKNEHNITPEEEKLIKNWASALMWPNQRNFK